MTKRKMPLSNWEQNILET